MKNFLLLIITLNFLNITVMAQGRLAKLVAFCEASDRSNPLTLCVSKEPWTATAHQYVIRWNLKKDCRTTREGNGFHQFFNENIREDNKKKIFLKETSSILGLCLDKNIVKIDLESGDAKFTARSSNCNFLPVFGDPSYVEPKVRKTKMKCSFN